MSAAALRASAFAALSLCALAARPGVAAPAPADGDLLVRAGTVLPVDGPPIRDGAVLCRGGKIAAVGTRTAVGEPAGVEVLDLGPHAFLLPGLVAAASGLGAPGAGGPESVAPEIRALDGFDWFRPQTRALAGGVTTAYLDAPRRRVVGGQGAVVKTAGASAEARTLVASAGLHGAVGDPARNPPPLFEAPSSPDPVLHPLLPVRPQAPATRAAAVGLLRDALARGKGAAPGGTDPGLAALAEVAAGRSPLRLHADEAADVRAALALAAESGVRLVLAGARDGHLLADDIARAGAAVVFVSPVVPGRIDQGDDPVEARARAEAMATPAALAERGVACALAADDAALPDLLLVAAAHVRAGLAPDRALRAVTLDAARVLGVDGRVGSLAPGKDGDLVAFSGDPFDVRSTAVATVVDGVVAWRRPPEEGVLVLRAAAVHTGTGQVFAPGAVVVQGGRVVEAGADVGVPPGARIVERPDDVIVPGWVDGHSRLGLRADRGAARGNLHTAAGALDAVAPDDPSFAQALAAGVTTALVSPSGGGPVTGTTAVLKTGGGDLAARTLRAVAGVEVSLAGAGDLPGALQALRDVVKRAKEYGGRWDKYDKEVEAYEKAKKEYEAAKAAREKEESAKAKSDEGKPAADGSAPGARDGKGRGRRGGDGKPEEKPEPKPEEKKDTKPEEKKDEGKDGKKDEKPPLKEPKEPEKPATDLSLEPFRDVLRKKGLVFARAASVAEVEGALKVLREEEDLPCVIVQGDESWRAAASLRKHKVGVLLGPRVVFTVDGKGVNVARELAREGIPFGFASDATSGARDLPLLAAWAVRHGLGPSAAVKALTLDAARLLGVDDRVGSLEPGKDADLLLLDGDPFRASTRVRAVYVGGRAVIGE